MGGRCNQGNQIQAIFFTHRIELLLFLKRHIRKNQAVHIKTGRLLDKALRTIGKDNIRIRHEHHRNLRILSEPLYHIKNFIGRNATA